MVYQWTCYKENCNSSYIGESRRCLESRIKEHNTSTASAIFQHSSTHNQTDISQFEIIDQDRKQVSPPEAREAIHIRRSNPTLKYNMGKMNIPKIFNQILGSNNITISFFLQTLISHKILLQLQVVGPLGQLNYKSNGKPHL